MRSCLPLLLLLGCGPTRNDARLCPTWSTSLVPPVTTSLPSLVLVTIDGARAEEVLGRADLLPNLHRLVDRGIALGGADAPMIASGPRFVSLPGYREILTGRRGTTCRDNDCAALDEPTLLDELRLAGGLSSDDVVAIASWEVVDRAVSIAPASLLISAGRHAGATRERLAVSDDARRDLEAGERSSARPGHGDYRPDALTAQLALDVVAARRPRILWVALGDTDEHAHRGSFDGYLAALAAADAFLGRLVAAIDLQTTMVLVTADHGRSANFRDHGDSPESSAVWLVAAGGHIPRVGMARTTTTHRLADIAPTVRALLHLGRDDSPRAGEEIPELL
jgi:hypothetical protein